MREDKRTVMRMAFLTLATALALSGTPALSETKPAETKPALTKSTKVEALSPPAAGAGGNRVEAEVLQAPAGGKGGKDMATGGADTELPGSDAAPRRAS